MSRTSLVQRPWPGPRPPRAEADHVHTLPVDRLHPVIRIAHRRPEPMRIRPRIIFDHELVLIVAGEGELHTSTGDVRAFAPGHLLLIRPFVPHAIYTTLRRDNEGEQSCEHLAVHFDLAPDVPAEATTPDRRLPYEVRFERGLALPDHVALAADDPVHRALAAVVETWNGHGVLGRLTARVHLEQALLALLGRGQSADDASDAAPAGSARNRARLERAVRHIEQHYDQPMEATHLAEVAGLSASHFNRLFRQWTGYAPADYVRRVRIARARTLLAEPDLTVKEIAARTGFADPYHFSKVFRQIDGLSPTAYREAALAGRRPADADGADGSEDPR